MSRGHAPALTRWLTAAILVFLWGAAIEDALLFLGSWARPDIWFQLLQHASPSGFDVALLRRAGGQWAAFALLQGITLARWRKHPVWLAVAAGGRFSDLFTDIAYMISVPSLTTWGAVLLTAAPCLNLLGVVILLRAHARATRNGAAGADALGRSAGGLG